MCYEIGQMSKAVAQLESIVEEDMPEEEKKNNRKTIDELLGMMNKLINIESNRVEADINYRKTEIEMMNEEIALMKKGD